MNNKLINKILNISNKEEYFGKKIIFDIVIGVIAILFAQGDIQTKLIGHVLILFWISISVSQVVTVFEKKKCGFLLHTNESIKNSYVNMWFKISVKQNKLNIIIMFAYIYFFFNNNILIAGALVILYITYATCIGIFIGNVFRKSIGSILITIFYGVCFLGTWFISAEMQRYFSPTIQLFNTDVINISNIYCLIVLSISLVVFSIIFSRYKSRKVTAMKILSVVISICILSLIIPYEIYHNDKIINSGYSRIYECDKFIEYAGIEEKDARKLIKILDRAEKKSPDYNEENKINKIYIKRGYSTCIKALSNIYKFRRIPIKKEGDSLYITIFSDAMLNLNQEEIIYDWNSRVEMIIRNN